jgi:phosphoserine aminotransferase
MKRIFNFSAGPAILPIPVLEEASQGIHEIGGSGMSVLEVSHRGTDYERIHYDARNRMLKLMGLDPSAYTVLFLGGGASLQFAMLPMNILSKDASADYVHTGEWSSRAMNEAKLFGKVNVAGSSEDGRFAYIPKSLKLDPSAKYLHITTNNTIEGTEFSNIPDSGGMPLVADASSDILSRQLDFSKFSMVYAGAQKNLGPAGVTLVVARKSFLEQSREDIPMILGYKTHAKNDSLYNTPPVFGVYVVGLVLKWIEGQGGLKAVEERNRRKAGMIYSVIDENPDCFEAACRDREDRSLMSITFRLRDADREKEFLAGAQAKGMDGLKGHRSVGGFRASVYNAFPEEGCAALAQYLRDFSQK